MYIKIPKVKVTLTINDQKHLVIYDVINPSIKLSKKIHKKKKHVQFCFIHNLQSLNKTNNRAFSYVLDRQTLNTVRILISPTFACLAKLPQHHSTLQIVNSKAQMNIYTKTVMDFA